MFRNNDSSPRLARLVRRAGIDVGSITGAVSSLCLSRRRLSRGVFRDLLESVKGARAILSRVASFTTYLLTRRPGGGGIIILRKRASVIGARCVTILRSFRGLLTRMIRAL